MWRDEDERLHGGIGERFRKIRTRAERAARQTACDIGRRVHAAHEADSPALACTDSRKPFPPAEAHDGGVDHAPSEVVEERRWRAGRDVRTLTPAGYRFTFASRDIWRFRS